MIKIIDIGFCTIGHSFLLTNQVRSVNISFREADLSVHAPYNTQKYGWICLRWSPQTAELVLAGIQQIQKIKFFATFGCRSRAL